MATKITMTIVPLEKSDMLEKVNNFPDNVAEAFTLSKDIVLPSNYSNISNILVLGMGGSGIVGDFIRVLLRNSAIPVHVNKHMLPPRFVNENTLVLAITYSGKTEETLLALKSCVSSGAKIISVTSSNELGSICERKKIPCVTVPENGQSRASLGYLLVPSLCILENNGILRRVENEIMETVEVLNNIKRECQPDLPLEKNLARSLAFDLIDRFPIIYGEYNFSDIIALRWKQQFNENSKVHCYYDVFPELLHNEIEAWDTDGQVYKNYALVLLRDSIYEREVGLQQKISATEYMIQQKGAKVREYWSKGRSELTRLLSLSYLGDFASVYLAIAKGIDASAVHSIEFMKRFTFGKEMVVSEYK